MSQQTVDRAAILQLVVNDLDGEDSPLYEMIDKTITEPYLPGERPRESVVVLAALGQEILNLVAKSVDDVTTRRIASPSLTINRGERARRQALRRLETFRDHLLVTAAPLPILAIEALTDEVSDIQALLSFGAEEDAS